MSLRVISSRPRLALTAPAGIPDAILRKASTDLRDVLSQADLRKSFASLGTYPRAISPEETAAFIKSEQALWNPIVTQVMLTSH
ncbi:MAG TPA: tripartite tricarboxylate transporter substrate-binding protein [Pirellulales bacterium]|jgi:tripartite-type tricarboxylate transporter receptor subunit TctC